MKPDFEKMAISASTLLYDETGSPMPQIVETRIADALRAAYAAGLERAAEIADNDASVGNQEIRVKTAAWRIAKTIRAEKEE